MVRMPSYVSGQVHYCIRRPDSRYKRAQSLYISDQTFGADIVLIVFINLKGNSLFPLDGELGIERRPFFIPPADPENIVSPKTVH